MRAHPILERGALLAVDVRADEDAVLDARDARERVVDRRGRW
jgi:hypothetical protein